MTGSLSSILANLGTHSGNTQLFSATCAFVDDKFRVYRGGLEIPVVWLESASPRVGSCLVAMDTPPGGQSTAYVLGFTFDQPFRWQEVGTVIGGAAAGFCTVEPYSAVGAEPVPARYMSHYTPAAGDKVMLKWSGGEAYVMGRFPLGHSTSTANQPRTPPMPDLPRIVDRGTSDFPASMFRVWDTVNKTWAQQAGRSLRLDSTLQGVWVYAGVTAALVDKKTIESVTFTLGNRLIGDGNNDPITVQFYRSDMYSFATDAGPTNIDGPFNVVIPANYTGTPLSLPVELGTALVKGGSISMKTQTAISFADSPASGHLRVAWRNVDKG